MRATASTKPVSGIWPPSRPGKSLPEKCPACRWCCERLVVLLLAPAATLVLLVPVAVLTLVPVRRRTAVRVVRGLAGLPAVLFAGYGALALAAGRVALWPAQPLRLALVIVVVVLAVFLIGRSRGDEPVTAG